MATLGTFSKDFYDRMYGADPTMSRMCHHTTTAGEMALTTNPQQVAFRGVSGGSMTVWCRGYSVTGAPMGAGVPLFSHLVVCCDGSVLQHPPRQTTSASSRGFPLLLDAANTRHEFKEPRLFGTLQAGGAELRTLDVQVQTPAGAIDDGAGNPLYASLVLELLFDTMQVQHDPSLIEKRRAILADATYTY